MICNYGAFFEESILVIKSLSYALSTGLMGASLALGDASATPRLVFQVYALEVSGAGAAEAGRVSRAGLFTGKPAGRRRG